MSMDNFWRYFYEIYETIPRQGPGDRESTERALRLLPPLTNEHRILDIGCGSGAQTIDLARATEAQIVAVDNHHPFINTLAKRAAERKLGAKITAQVGDMNDLQFPDGSFDVIWSEGAIGIIGFAEGLTKWRRLLAPGGYMVVSEYCWFHDNPPAELRAMFLDDCPDAGDVEARREAIAASGYRLLDEFVLPEVGWWENYYVPLGQSLRSFRETHAKNPDALAVASRSQQEIDLYQSHSGAFGYVFFIMQPI
ncbi:MAG: methyltransferase domain-containing protein [Deltaproteobacteria bacterium]|nr:methyltransferase domain-containing protein [Deltaproteobacteria bacterium]